MISLIRKPLQEAVLGKPGGHSQMPKKLTQGSTSRTIRTLELLKGVSFTMSGGVVHPGRPKGFLSADILSCGLGAGGRSGREVWAQAGHGRSRCSRARAEQ